MKLMVCQFDAIEEVRARAAERSKRRLTRDCVHFSIESLDWITASEQARATTAAQIGRVHLQILRMAW